MVHQFNNGLKLFFLWGIEFGYVVEKLRNHIAQSTSSVNWITWSAVQTKGSERINVKLLKYGGIAPAINVLMTSEKLKSTTHKSTCSNGWPFIFPKYGLTVSFKKFRTMS